MASHRWSGWPGAYCLKCGSEDAMENAIGLGWYDPWYDKWDTLEHQAEVLEAIKCPVTELEWAEHLEKIGKLHLWKEVERMLKEHRKNDIS